MTLERLQQHFELRRKLRDDEALLASLRDRAYPGAQTITGMPHATGTHDKVGDLAIEIAYLEEVMAPLRERVDADAVEIQEFIRSIEDHVVAITFSLRYLRGMPWKDVAETLGGGNTENGVKMLCYRYLG